MCPIVLGHCFYWFIVISCLHAQQVEVLASFKPLSSSDPVCLSVLFNQVSPEKCRFAIGRILSEGDAKPSEEQIKRFQKYGFKIFSFPAPSHVVMATFPFTTPLSIHLAVNRVHPALDAYIKVSECGVRSVACVWCAVRGFSS